MPQTSSGALPRLNVTSLSQYVRLENCDRFLRLRLRPDEERALLKRWNLTLQPLTPLLQESGAQFEREIMARIAGHGEVVIDLDGQDVTATAAALRQIRQPTILLQPSVEAPLGNYLCHGRADVIRLERDRKGALRVMIADIKATRHERMEHRLQVATYAHILRSMAGDERLVIDDMRGAVVIIPEDGNLPPLDSSTPTFDLGTYLTILERLAIAPDSTVVRINEMPFSEVPYHLGYKCDGCMYNAICMYDSAERLDVSLVPHLSAVEKRVLLQAGITTLPQVARLMTLPARNSGSQELRCAPGQEAVVAALSNQWPVGPNLPTIVQRARQALRRFDPTVEAAPFLFGAQFGTLPSTEDHPDLVKVFFDAQHDYIQDRVYLISAVVKGPRGARAVVRCLTAPPTEASERDLLIGWVHDVLGAMRQVAANDRTEVHLYCYNRYDQKVLLEAIKRHIEQVAALPAFFDLMTQSPALTQPIISFLADELAERLNLGIVCAPLHDAARALGFDWRDDKYEFYRLFRARLFDNRRDVLRLADGRLTPADANTPKDAPGRVTIEAASRFNSQIPLEYAYAAWECLPTEPRESRILEPFRQITLDQLNAFAVHRARALAHIEDAFKVKARWIHKEPVNLPALAGAADQTPTLAQSLEEFLFMEHHTAFQAKQLTYSLPIERRAQTGLALLLRYTGVQVSQTRFRFAIAFDALGLDPTLTMNAFRLKEGGWVVINPTNPPTPASRIKNGRLAIIRAVGADWIELELLSISFRNGFFRYIHNTSLTPQPGVLYTLDEMADDLNTDKTLEALRNANANILYRWLCQQPGQRPAQPGTEQWARQFADLVDTLERGARLTAPQREVIAGRFAEPLLLVQGPPGTGKSHTLAWAVLARLAARAAQGQPFRVAVSCKTHNAVNIVLEAIARKQRKLTGFATALTRGLGPLQVYKLAADDSTEAPDGVRLLDAYNTQVFELQAIMQKPLVVIGGTPGGLYNLARYSSYDRKTVNWAQQPFDLLVIDEASQMSVPEGVLAGAFLKPAGAAIVVGDHRQMPPIIAHAWEDEQKRTAIAHRPYLSLFESLIERGFPRVALDESFRLHECIAEFLQDNIYSLDGIHFFSRRKELLTPPPPRDVFVDRALDPRYPIVVIEHAEARSQQYNETEIELVAPLIDVCANGLRLDGRDGVGVVVPHRAQRAMLRERFPDLAVADSVDTVERFQGGERDVIIVSATASDPDYVLAEADFLLNLNRLNVALSRPRKKLIVVASRSVISLLVSDLKVFDNAVIWKRLYYQYAADVLWTGERCGVPVWLRGRRAF